MLKVKLNVLDPEKLVENGMEREGAEHLAKVINEQLKDACQAGITAAEGNAARQFGVSLLIAGTLITAWGIYGFKNE